MALVAAFEIILASASPRRRELLRQIGIEPDVRPAAVSEDPRPGEDPRAQARRLAEAKGRAVARALPRDGPVRVVLAADTVVIAGGTPLGKPRDGDEARDMLRRLAGGVHDVVTALWVERTDDGRTASCLESSRVRFRSIPEAVIAAYVATGEPMDKAGAYAIQGRGGLLVESVEGSWTNVVGLPIERIPTLLSAIGLDLTADVLSSI
jgi:septum formation protein